MNTSIRTEQSNPTHEQVALVAYQLWKKGGCQPGHDRDYWLQAEKQLVAALATGQKVSSETRTAGPVGNSRVAA
jgi:hypothetical protein